jgi:hypothetical protein
VASLRRFLDTVSSGFERLILVAYLRDSNGDRRLNKLTREYSYAEVIASLRQIHMEVFVAWLNMPLSEQRADIRAYLADPDDRTRMLASLAETGCAAIPPEAKPHEAQLFNQDLEMIRVGLLGAARSAQSGKPSRCSSTTCTRFCGIPIVFGTSTSQPCPVPLGLRMTMGTHLNLNSWNKSLWTSY